MVALAYSRLADSLRRGVYAAGSRLPGERDLAAQLGVSRATLRQALALLAEDGSITASAQRGWYVSRQVMAEPPSVLQSFSEMARSRGLRPSARILRQELRVASMDEASRLRVAPASRVVTVERLRGLDGVPVCTDVTVVVASRAPTLADLDLTDRSLYETLEDSFGVVIARSAYAVQAEAADDRLAALLDLAPGAPVLVGDEVAYDAEGVPVLLGRTVYRGDAYRFEADLYRPLS
ncbi:GntR family transcriptional regulator [Nonomuraea roseola]